MLQGSCLLHVGCWALTAGHGSVNDQVLDVMEQAQAWHPSPPSTEIYQSNHKATSSMQGPSARSSDSKVCSAGQYSGAWAVLCELSKVEGFAALNHLLKQ